MEYFAQRTMYKPNRQFKIELCGKLGALLGNRKTLRFLGPQAICMKKEIRLSTVLQRELKGKVLSRVAREVGMSVSLLHDWYSSARKPSAKNLWQLKLLAEHLGLTLEEILFDEPGGRQIISATTFTDRGAQYRISIEKVRGS